MTVTKIEFERFSVTTSKPFETVVAALEAAIGHPDINEFQKAMGEAPTFVDLEGVVQQALGKAGLMLFMRLDPGMVLRKESGLDRPKILHFLVGNPLIMKEMARHVPDAAAYVPIAILVDERPDGVHLAFDKMASILAPYGNSHALAIARELDMKIENLLRESAA